MDIRDLISSMVLFFLASCVLVISLGLGIGSLSHPQAGFLPFWISVLIVSFSLVLFTLAYRRKDLTVRWSDLWRDLNWPKNVAVMVALTIYVLVLNRLGYLIGTFGLMLVLFAVNRTRPWVVVAGSLACVFLSYALFYGLLKTPLPRGLWGF